MDETVKILRSLMNLHGGLLVQEIDEEYKNDVGESVPFKRFGFENLIDFLRSTGQFTATKTMAGLKISAKLTDASAHIVKFQQQQNVSKGERKRRKRLAMGQPNASLARSNVIGGPKMSRSRNNMNTAPKKNTNPQNRMRRAYTGNNTQRAAMPRVTNSNPRPALAPISNHATSQRAQNIQNKYPKQSTQNQSLAHKFGTYLHSQQSAQNMKPPEDIVNVPPTNVRPTITNENVQTTELKPFIIKPISKSSQKIDLHARMAPKHIEPDTPPDTPPSSLSSDDMELPNKTAKLDLPARMVQKQPDIGLKTPFKSPRPILSASYTPKTTPPLNPRHEIAQTPTSSEISKRVDLRTRLSMKQLQPVESDQQESDQEESTPPPVLRPSRSTLLKMYHNMLREQQQQKSTENSKSKTRVVSFKPQHVVIEPDSSKCNGLKCDLNSRLQPKPTNFNSELDQMSKQVNLI